MADDAKQGVEPNFEQALNDTLYNSVDKGHYIGMMSGTSLDGLDAVICQFDNDIETTSDNSRNNIIAATHSCDFPIQLRQVLLALCQPNNIDKLSGLAIDSMEDEDYPQSELDWFGWASRAYGEFASQVVNELLAQADIGAESVLAIGCHGQTVRHRPNLGFSLQLVDPSILAERTGISVVSDFRRRDMAVGGQGAPLAPAFHLAQFGNASDDDTTHRIIVNLGGIANITVLRANQTHRIIGYDTGPANILLDTWYQFNIELHDLLGQHPSYLPLYDKDGQWAKTGEVNQSLLDALLTHPYFDEPTPKSTGREAFHLGWLDEQISQVKTETQQDISSEDIQATLTALTVQTLSNAIHTETERLNLNPVSSEDERLNGPIGDVVICGGGAYNTYLLQQLAKALPNWNVVTSEHFGIAPTWVEAMAFAWLARQTIMGEVGNLPAVTGASKGVVLGQVCFA